MGKNSFTLFETLLSTLLLSIIVIGFLQYSYYDNFEEEYILLNKIENSFTTKNFSSDFTISTKQIKVIKNDLEEINIPVKTITFKNEKISLIKYEMQ